MASWPRSHGDGDGDNYYRLLCDADDNNKLIPDAVVGWTTTSLRHESLVSGCDRIDDDESPEFESESLSTARNWRRRRSTFSRDEAFEKVILWQQLAK